MTGPLVVAPSDEDAEAANAEGAGVLSSAADLHEALTEPALDTGQVAFAATAYGLDLLAVAMDPLDELAQAGVGWLIEHVWFLHEPLDALAGDPTRIRAQAQTWANASLAMSAVAEQLPRQAAVATGWDGVAAATYGAAVADYSARLGLAATAAGAVSEQILFSGVAVGTVRALIRDLIAEFVGGVIAKALVAAAGSFVSFGGSFAAFAATVGADAAQLAGHIARRVQQLLDTLAASAQRLRDAATLVERLRDGLVEAGKQLTSAEQERRAWPAAP